LGVFFVKSGIGKIEGFDDIVVVDGLGAGDGDIFFET